MVGGRVVQKRHSPPAGVLAVHGGKLLKGGLAACQVKFCLDTVASDIYFLCLRIYRFHSNICSTEALEDYVIFLFPMLQVSVILRTGWVG